MCPWGRSAAPDALTALSKLFVTHEVDLIRTVTTEFILSSILFGLEKHLRPTF